MIGVGLCCPEESLELGGHYSRPRLGTSFKRFYTFCTRLHLSILALASSTLPF